MTDTGNVPTARPRKILTQIAAVSWEHPADRAALQGLRAVPGFDEVVKKIFGFLGERGVRLLFQADAVRVGPTQFPRLDTLFASVWGTFKAGIDAPADDIAVINAAIAVLSCGVFSAISRSRLLS